MGCIFSLCSADSLPDIPKDIQAPPDVNAEPVTFAVAKLGSWGRDYGVWRGTVGKKDKLWWWINKAEGAQPGQATIDMENWDRDEKTKKGKVFWSASIVERPTYEQFQRPCAQGGFNSFRFMGIDSGYESDPDDFMIGKLQSKKKTTTVTKGAHTGQQTGQRVMDAGVPMVSKWRLRTSAVIKDGNLGRGSDLVGQDPIYLEVFSKGSGATCWQVVDKRTEVPDGTPAEGQPQRYRIQASRSVEKTEMEWVDRIEYRLSCRGQPIGRPWVVPGDSHPSNSDGITRCDFFESQCAGGFFSKGSVTTTTKPGMDPILSLLISHLVATEFSIAEIKSDLKLNTPANPPSGPNAWPMPPISMLAYKPPQAVNMAGPPFPGFGAMGAGLSSAASSVGSGATWAGREAAEGASAAGSAISSGAQSAYHVAGSVDWKGGAEDAGQFMSQGAESAWSASTNAAQSAYGAAAGVDWAGGANAAGQSVVSGAEMAWDTVDGVDFAGGARDAGYAMQGAAEDGIDALKKLF